MDLTIIKEYIKPELFVLVPLLYGLGMALKASAFIKDKFIPLILILIGIVLAGLWMFATMPIATSQDMAMIVFMAVVQGGLCASAPIAVNQLIVQGKKPG